MKELLNKYSFIGIRVSADDEEYNVGDTCRYSYEWDYENDCSTFNTENPIKLNGTCALEIIIDEDMEEKEIQNIINEMRNQYVGEQTTIIGGHEREYGSDENEIIINDAIVLVIL